MWIFWLVHRQLMRKLSNHATLPGCQRQYQMAFFLVLAFARTWSLVSTDLLIHRSVKEKASTQTNKQTNKLEAKDRQAALSSFVMLQYKIAILPNSYSVLRCYCVKLVRYDPLFVKRFWAYTIFGRSKVQCWNPKLKN